MVHKQLYNTNTGTLKRATFVKREPGPAILAEDDRADLLNMLRTQREQLARDLHDGIGSQLTHIVSKLEVLAYRHQELESQLISLRDFASETIRQLRESIWVLKQRDIRFGLFSERIKCLLLRIFEDSDPSRLRVTVRGDESLLMPPAMATCVFRIIQEAINNSLKYAGATMITVCMAFNKEGFILQVSDNGTGFGMEEVTKGNGLANIRERVEELSGKVHMASEQGFHLVVELPLI